MKLAVICKKDKNGNPTGLTINNNTVVSKSWAVNVDRANKCTHLVLFETWNNTSYMTIKIDNAFSDKQYPTTKLKCGFRTSIIGNIVNGTHKVSHAINGVLRYI